MQGKEQARMATHFDERVLVLAGSRDGLYLFESDGERVAWQRRGPFLEGCDVSHAVLDPRDGRTIWVAASGHGVTAVYRSPDRGGTWAMAGEPFEAGQVWHVEPGHADQPGRVFAGLLPAALYRSDDDGGSWQALPGLNAHPTRDEWWEGGGGLCLHTVLTNPIDPHELHVAISVAGVFHSADGGETWTPRNDGLFSFAQDPAAVQHPHVHRCVHKVVRHPDEPQILFQQNHMGVYRTDDGGMQWVEIGTELPGRFGFVITITRDGAVYVVPQDEDKVRFSGQLSVYRSRDRGGSWQQLTHGLPEIENQTLYREGMASDWHTPGGVYFGTSAGDLFHTRDGGDSWATLATGLPAVRSVSCEHFS
jgi:photosystem II stability/assembly factor-like uncharacterized protein